jgi:hypothetical protein
MAKFTIVTNRRLYKDDLARIPLEVSYRLYQNQVFLYVTDYHSNNFEPIECRLIEWINTNCRGLYRLYREGPGFKIFFEYIEDMTAFKLRWEGTDDENE